MYFSEVNKRVAKVLGINQEITEVIIRTFLTEVMDQVIAGNKVNLTGFGSFNVLQKNKRWWYDRFKGERRMIYPKALPEFNPSKYFRESVANEWSWENKEQE